MTTTNTTVANNVLMTLAGLAATAATPRPSGETSDAHAARIAAGIGQQLGSGNLATGADWSLSWLALSPANANLVYVAQSIVDNAIAVCVRGTVALLSNIAEDLDVGTVVAFQVSSAAQPVAVSA